MSAHPGRRIRRIPAATVDGRGHARIGRDWRWLTAVAGPLFDISTDAATQLLDRQPYVRAVFPDGAP